MAAYCAKADIKCEIFVPKGTSPKKIDMIKSHGARVYIVPGTRDHCADVCRADVRDEGKYYANHVYNPFFYGGTKLHRIPKHLFVPLGNGTLFIGELKALEEFLNAGIIDKIPQIVAVQSENCAPFMKSIEIRSKKVQPVEVKPTLAEGIPIGIPMRGEEILESIYKYNISVVTAPENQILEARTALSARGIYCEHTTSASYAAYRRYCRIYGSAEDSLISMCGAGLKSSH